MLSNDGSSHRYIGSPAAVLRSSSLRMACIYGPVIQRQHLRAYDSTGIDASGHVSRGLLFDSPADCPRYRPSAEMARLDLSSPPLQLEPPMREYLSVCTRAACHSLGAFDNVLRHSLWPGATRRHPSSVPTLKHLYCGCWTYSGAIFDSILPRMRSLRLEIGNHTGPPFPVAVAMRFVERVRRG
ncbi:hypothetical protein OBBRIDRAFT_577982 [Obba rivulosa]|uniref:Uncharacterized protein n=1 Tax=Obba rivulosa TaxID=1052685 RepID=A0A8E2DT87_9APHY|nr:hypothetical protein OBBRIDRAFT_577982 [Obba rivulosa]